MADHTALPLPTLPAPVERILRDFTDTACHALGSDLHSIVLFGSAAEGRLRPTSDVNVILVLTRFVQAKVDLLRDSLRVAYAAIRLTPMFLLEEEIEAAATAFAQKFSDILRRRCVVYGPDPFAAVSVPRGAIITRLKQVLLNLTLRMRELYVLRSLREEQLVLVIADMAGPLRSCAATLHELEGQPTTSPKEALAQLASSLSLSEWQETLAHLSEAREKLSLPSGVAEPTVFRLIDLAQRMRARVETLG
jgi:predicted nucleotidyltransferase